MQELCKQTVFIGENLKVKSIYMHVYWPFEANDSRFYVHFRFMCQM